MGLGYYAIDLSRCKIHLAQVPGKWPMADRYISSTAIEHMKMITKHYLYSLACICHHQHNRYVHTTRTLFFVEQQDRTCNNQLGNEYNYRPQVTSSFHFITARFKFPIPFHFPPTCVIKQLHHWLLPILGGGQFFWPTRCQRTHPNISPRGVQKAGVCWGRGDRREEAHLLL